MTNFETTRNRQSAISSRDNRTAKWKTTLINSLIIFVYPAQCRCCQKPMGVGKVPYICDECWSLVELIEKPFCEICGKPLTESKGVCKDCRKNPPIYSKARAIARYNKTMRQTIHLLKYEKKKVMLKYLSVLIRKQLPDLLALEDYDYLLPVPLHKKRLRERGFNQAELIGRIIGSSFDVQMTSDNLTRIRNTLPQSSLETSKEKHRNVQDAFVLRNPERIKEKKILIVDDILTTGATVSEIARVLLDAEAEQVDVFTLANAG